MPTAHPYPVPVDVKQLVDLINHLIPGATIESLVQVLRPSTRAELLYQLELEKLWRETPAAADDAEPEDKPVECDG